MITQQIKNQICEEYNKGTALVNLSKKYKHSHPYIKRLLLEEGIKLRNTLESRHRKYSYDKSFFKKIDTEEKAYWLGFLYADGCVTDSGVNLLLDQLDYTHIEKYKAAIQFTGPIEKRSDKIDYGEKYGVKESFTAKVRIGSHELRDDLIRLGCMPRKTFVLKFPTEENVPRDLIHHFIRGYFDGDGTVYIRKYQRKDGQKRGFAMVIGTFDIIQNMKQILCRLDINENEIYFSHHPTSDGIFRFQCCTIDSMKKFRDFLYQNATIYLERKREKFYELNLDKIPWAYEEIMKEILEFLKINTVCNVRSFGNKYAEFQVRIAINKLLEQKKLQISDKTSRLNNYSLV